MKQPWHVANPALKADVTETLARDFPGLAFSVEGDVAKIRGPYTLQHEGEVLDRFAIEMVFPARYPDDLPTLFEVGGRIPRTETRHTSPDGSACLEVPEAWLIERPDALFGTFMDGPVRNFFLWQVVFESGGTWPYGEHVHGPDGAVRYYQELFQTDDVEAVLQYADYLARPEIKGHWPCPCGSGAILRKCHLMQLRELRARVNPGIAERILARLQATAKEYALTNPDAVPYLKRHGWLPRDA